MSINWGPWEELRQLSRAEHDELKRLGFDLLPSDPAFSVLGGLLAVGETQKVVVAVDWTQFLPAFAAKRERRFLERIERQVQPTRPAKPPRAAEFMQGLASASPDRRLEMLEDQVHGEVARVLGRVPCAGDRPAAGLF